MMILMKGIFFKLYYAEVAAEDGANRENNCGPNGKKISVGFDLLEASVLFDKVLSKSNKTLTMRKY